MLRILYIITQPHYGGAQKYVRDLATSLAPEQYEVFVAVGNTKSLSHKVTESFSTFNWLNELRDAGIKVIELKHVQRALSLWHDLLSGFELFKLYKQVRPDVIHLNSSKVGAIGSVIAALYRKIYKRNLKTIYTVHGFILNEPLSLWRKGYYYLAEKISGYFKDIIICVSRHDKQSLLQWKVAPDTKIHVIHNGIDFSSLKFLARESARDVLTQDSRFQIPNSDILIGTIAGLYKTKGLEHLICSARILLDTLPEPFDKTEIKFVVIGSGPEQNSLKQLAKNLKLQANLFITSIEESAAQYLKAFDIFVLPSVKEGLPYTLIEARAAGLPIIATHVGGIPEIIEHNKTGLLVEPANPDEVSRAIKELINNDNLRHKLAAAAPQNLARFSLEQMVKATTQLY